MLQKCPLCQHVDSYKTILSHKYINCKKCFYEFKIYNVTKYTTLNSSEAKALNWLSSLGVKIDLKRMRLHKQSDFYVKGTNNGIEVKRTTTEKCIITFSEHQIKKFSDETKIIIFL